MVWLTSRWEVGASPYLHASWQAFGCEPLELFNHVLPEREFSEEDQQVAMKRDEPTSLLYSPFIRNSPRFTSITVTFP